MPKCSLCKIGNVKEYPEFGLCPNCLKDMKIFVATLMEISVGGTKPVDMEELFVKTEKRMDVS